MKKYDIYMIWCKDANGDILKYYGSTADFIKRKSYHKNNYKKWVEAGRPNNKKCSSVLILDNGNWRMDKIDEIVGERWEAKLKEGEYIKNNDCVNLNIASRTAKEWRTDNKDKLVEQIKQYRVDNKVKISENCKKYRLAHLDKISEKYKEWYDKNKNEILQKLKQKIICECGAEVTRTNIYNHLKTKKHINFINSNNNN